MRSVVMWLPEGTSLEAALNAYYSAGWPKGSHRSGVSEVQTDAGIYEQKDGNRIDLSTPRKAAKVFFKTWAELDANNNNNNEKE